MFNLRNAYMSSSHSFWLFSSHASCFSMSHSLFLGVSFSVLLTLLAIRLGVLSLCPQLHQLWAISFGSIASKDGVRFVWRKKYPSFEDMHALFDRGDALLAAVYVATTFQLGHEEVSKVLKTHSVYQTDPLRRLVRTLTFIRITVRANSKERSQIVSWLNKLHVNIKLFNLETNVFVLSTIAFGLGRAHQVLGAATDIEVDALVSAIMNMAKQLIPNGEVQDMSVPTTLRDVSLYLSKQVNCSLSDMEESCRFLIKISTLGGSSKNGGHLARALSLTASILFKPLLLAKAFIVRKITQDLSFAIFGFESPNSRPGIALSILRRLQPFYSHFHYSLCPSFLTFDGFFEVLKHYEPRLEVVMDEVYGEIFGENAAETKLRQRKDKSMGAHLPQLQIDPGTTPQPSPLTSPSLFCEVMEHLKCSYLRGQLQGRSVPQHLGVIMDGNRRFSKLNLLGSPMEGHQLGARKLVEFMSWCFSSGVKNLTVWALSDDNLKRGKDELDPLFTMMGTYIQEIVMGDTPLTVLDVRFRMVGDKSILPENLALIIHAAEKATRNNSKFNMQIALGYGGRAEATRAMKRAAEFLAREECLSTEEALSSLTSREVSRHTYSAELGLPEIDAILRTSGENRLSGFALWDTHGAEISFLEAHWPALKESDFLQSILDLSRRNRRFGA